MSTVASLPFVPFARPALDADTIRSVGEVLASGRLTSGPKVDENERLVGERAGRSFLTLRVIPAVSADVERACAAPAAAGREADR